MRHRFKIQVTYLKQLDPMITRDKAGFCIFCLQAFEMIPMIDRNYGIRFRLTKQQ